MKRIIMIFTVFCVILGCLTGCSGAKSSDGKSSSEQLSVVSDENKGEASKRSDSSDEADIQNTDNNDEINQFESAEIKAEEAIKTEFVNENAYIDIHSYYVTKNINSDSHGDLDCSGDAYMKNLSVSDDLSKYNNTNAIVTFMTKPNVLYINIDNNEFMQFYSDSDVVYYDGEYSISEENNLRFNYKNAYLYTNSFDDIYYHPDNVYMDKVAIQDVDYEYDYWNPELETELHDVSNANNCGFVSHINASISWYFDDFPEPFLLTNINGENKWTQPSENDTYQVYIRDNYIITNQKGWFFNEANGTNSFILEYSNSELLNEPENVRAYLSSDQELEDLQIDNFKVQFHADKTWDILDSTECNYTGENSGKWELIDEHILAIIGPKDSHVIGNINFLYLDFENNEIYIPLFVECPSMLPLMDEFNELRD